MLHPVARQEDSGEGLRVLRLLLAELPAKVAARLTAEITGAARNDLYDAALQIKREGAAEDE